MVEIAAHAASFEKLSENSLFLVLGAFTSIFGTHTINTLRIEAYEAKLLNQYRLGRKLGPALAFGGSSTPNPPLNIHSASSLRCSTISS